MGAWEVGMASNRITQSISDRMLPRIPFPTVEGGKGVNIDVCAWNGGGYAVSASSPVKDESIKLLNYMMHPDKTGRRSAGSRVLSFPDRITRNT